jgi:phosphopantothenoylcysteine decarboxylase/phosphopantothenate--cysteine ligase
MAEPQAIFDAAMAMLEGPRGRPLAGKHVLVTAGPTAEALDPVRLLTNRSSGRQGFAIAAGLAALGARVTLVAGPVSLPTPSGVKRVDVESAREMLAACEAALPADAAVCVAAVADWRPDEAFGIKLKKGKDGPPALRLVENPDILATLARPGPDRPRLVVGFAAETGDVVAYAKAKVARKGCDWIVANDVSPGTGTFGGDENRVHLIRADGTVEDWPRASKAAIAGRLVAAIADRLASAEGAR